MDVKLVLRSNQKKNNCLNWANWDWDLVRRIFDSINRGVARQLDKEIDTTDRRDRWLVSYLLCIELWSIFKKRPNYHSNLLQDIAPRSFSHWDPTFYKCPLKTSWIVYTRATNTLINFTKTTQTYMTNLYSKKYALTKYIFKPCYKLVLEILTGCEKLEKRWERKDSLFWENIFEFWLIYTCMSFNAAATSPMQIVCFTHCEIHFFNRTLVTVW